jgi:hypothetical protein
MGRTPTLRIRCDVACADRGGREAGIGLTLPTLYLTGGFDKRPLSERQRASITR